MAGLGLLAILGFLSGGAVYPGVKYGDAVPGVVRPADLERIKRVLHLDRFSVIAAVRLGAEDGREIVLAEPLADEVLAQVKDGCEAGGFCPDPVGFVASRVSIVRLQGPDVQTLVTVDRTARGARGVMADLSRLGVEGEIVGWNGRPDAADGHVALSLTPVTRSIGARLGPGLDPPLLIRFNPRTDRFQVYDCVAGDGGQPQCDFLEEPG